MDMPCCRKSFFRVSITIPISLYRDISASRMSSWISNLTIEALPLSRKLGLRLTHFLYSVEGWTNVINGTVNSKTPVHPMASDTSRVYVPGGTESNDAVESPVLH